MRDVVSSPEAPAAIGPYSQAIRAGDQIWLSGQIPLDPATMQITGETAAEQAEQVLRNMSAVLAAAGASLADLVQVSIFLIDLADFAAVNEVYRRHVPDPPPARTTIQVSRLPRDARVEIAGIAWRPRT